VEVHVENPAVLHVGRQEAQRQARGLRPADGRPVAEGAVRPRQQHVALPVERQGADPGERLVVEIGQADIQIECVEAALDLDRCLRGHDDAGALVTPGECHGQERHDGQRHRDGADPELPDHAVAHLAQRLLQAAIVGEHALRPGKDPARPPR
jgi:hypothetical protein